MAILINLDVVLAKRKMSVTDLAEQVGITIANISIPKKTAKPAPSASPRSKPSANRCSVSREIFWSTRNNSC